jgi:hypothetical protein
MVFCCKRRGTKATYGSYGSHVSHDMAFAGGAHGGGAHAGTAATSATTWPLLEAHPGCGSGDASDFVFFFSDDDGEAVGVANGAHGVHIPHTGLADASMTALTSYRREWRADMATLKKRKVARKADVAQNGSGTPLMRWRYLTYWKAFQFKYATRSNILKELKALRRENRIAPKVMGDVT